MITTEQICQWAGGYHHGYDIRGNHVLNGKSFQEEVHDHARFHLWFRAVVVFGGAVYSTPRSFTLISPSLYFVGFHKKHDGA